MSRLLYSCCLWLLLPAIFLRLFWRGRRAPAYRKRWGERIGRVSAPTCPGGLWIHAVSVGETNAAVPLIKALLQRYPELPLIITTTTPTGSARVKQLFGDSVSHSYLPYDLPRFMNRFLDQMRPSGLVIMETEIWPNLIHCCSLRQLPIMIANGRISDAAWSRYRLVAGLLKPFVNKISMLAVQSTRDGDRFCQLGASQDKVVVAGNLKFDISPTAAHRKQADTLRPQLGARPVWVAASTHEGEDERVLEAFKQILAASAQALLILVPRHPERFDKVADLIQAQGLRGVRRSQGVIPAATDQVWLGDTMGELNMFYLLADVAFVGGSLVPVGGHNLLEPASCACPVLSGQHLHNFREVRDLLQAAEGLVVVDTVEAMVQTMAKWLEDPVLRERIGQNAFEAVACNQGTTQRMLGLIQNILGPSLQRHSACLQ